MGRAGETIIYGLGILPWRSVVYFTVKGQDSSLFSEEGGVLFLRVGVPDGGE